MGVVAAPDPHADRPFVSLGSELPAPPRLTFLICRKSLDRIARAALSPNLIVMKLLLEAIARQFRDSKIIVHDKGVGRQANPAAPLPDLFLHEGLLLNQVQEASPRLKLVSFKRQPKDQVHPRGCFHTRK